jgi:hypothetical protein
MARRKPKRKRSDLGYDEPVKPPDGADLEVVVRALLDVPRPREGQPTKDDPEPEGK